MTSTHMHADMPEHGGTQCHERTNDTDARTYEVVTPSGEGVPLGDAHEETQDFRRGKARLTKAEAIAAIRAHFAARAKDAAKDTP